MGNGKLTLEQIAPPLVLAKIGQSNKYKLLAKTNGEIGEQTYRMTPEDFKLALILEFSTDEEGKPN